MADNKQTQNTAENLEKNTAKNKVAPAKKTQNAGKNQIQKNEKKVDNKVAKSNATAEAKEKNVNTGKSTSAKATGNNTNKDNAANATKSVKNEISVNQKNKIANSTANKKDTKSSNPKNTNPQPKAEVESKSIAKIVKKADTQAPAPAKNEGKIIPQNKQANQKQNNAPKQQAPKQADNAKKQESNPPKQQAPKQADNAKKQENNPPKQQAQKQADNAKKQENNPPKQQAPKQADNAKKQENNPPKQQAQKQQAPKQQTQKQADNAKQQAPVEKKVEAIDSVPANKPEEANGNKQNQKKSQKQNNKQTNSKQTPNKQNNSKTNNKRFVEKRKTMLFTFQVMAPKSVNQVFLNKVKQVYGYDSEVPQVIEDGEQQNNFSRVRNYYARYNYIDMRRSSLLYQKRIIPNPSFKFGSLLPKIAINRYKEPKIDIEGNDTAGTVDLSDITLKNDVFGVKLISKNISHSKPAPKGKAPKVATPTEAPIKEEPAEKPKPKKKNKYEEEANALKNEVFVLPPEDYIKYTFPELEAERDKAREKSKREKARFTSINPEKKLYFSENMNPEIKAMLDRVMQEMDDQFSADEGCKIMLAVSGGVDSIALLDIFAQIAEIKKYNIYVAHFNHNLRGASSDRDEAAVKRICDEYGIKCYVSSENIYKYASENGVSIEQAARINRYKMFERLAGNLKLDYVATAHTSDDSVETFFLNLMRGTGLTGLSGIPKQRILIKTTYLIRPLLNLSKAELINYARLRQLTWHEDESNSLANYTRNKIRLELLPLIKKEFSPAIFELINRTSRLINGADAFIGEYVNNAAESLIKDRRKDRFHISIPQLQTYSEYIQSELIQALLALVFKTLPFGLKVIDRILALIDSPIGSIYNINKQIYVLKDRSRLIFALRNGTDTVNQFIKKLSETELPAGKLRISLMPKGKVEYTRDPNVEYIDGDLLPAILNVRNWEQGDSFKPLGMEGTMKISDFLTNQKVSLIEKQSILVISTKTEIVWVVGKRMSNDFKISSLTKNIYKLEFIPNKK